MSFSDLFYPGNPRRRQRVAGLRNEIKAGFDGCRGVKPLGIAATGLQAVIQSIKHGIYKLDDRHILVKLPDGAYRIIDTQH
jgi:hypothetical protein